MEEKELFMYGDKELNLNSLLNNIDSNLQSYLNYYSKSISDNKAFIEKINYIKEGMKNGTITTDGKGVYNDANGKFSKDDTLMNNALYYIDIIAKELSKETRSLTKSEIDAQTLKKLEDKTPKTPVQPLKKDFDSDRPFNFEYSLKSQFGPSLEIPYNTLIKSITKGDDGVEDYSVVKQQFQKAFDSMRSYLGEYNNSEQYINQVNDLESVLFDGIWDYRDELAIHQVGLNKDLNNLKELFTYKFPKYNPRQNYKQSIEQVINPGDFTVIDGDQKTILYLDENGKLIQKLITDDEYYQLSGTTPIINPIQSTEDVNLDELKSLLEEDLVGWEVLGPIALDIISIVDPEPISATVAGLGSDLFGIWLDIRNGGDTHWRRHGANVGATLLGAIPYIGDAGNVVKVGNKIVEASSTLNKYISNAKTIIDTLSKYHVKGLGAAGTGALALMDLTSEDSIILDQGIKALELIKNGEITAENVAAVGNAIAITMQLRKGWKNFRSLDPTYVKTSSTPSVPKPKPSFRDELTTRIKTNNSTISKKDLDAIQAALDKIPKEGLFTNLRLRSTKPSAEYLAAQKLLREKGHFSEAEIIEILKKISKHAKGGIIKAEDGMKTPWRLNYDGTTHLMDHIYDIFTQNISNYNAQQIVNSLNELNSNRFKSLNFKDADNTTGFRSWNETFNKSGLNDLFGYNESDSDYLGVTTRSRNDFVNYLKEQGTISTGTGDLSWDPKKNTWNYTSNEVEPEVKAGAEAEVKTGSETEIKAPDVAELSLKELDLKKPLDLNPNGIVNSLVGYIANEAANAKKQEIQKKLPLYLEIMHPEKAFKTAYTYDLENAKRELIAEANSIQPITSDVSAYYDAKNNAIKNARAYANKLDIEINDRIHQTVSDNQDIAYDNAVNRTDTANTNAKYRHDWEIELKQGEINLVDTKNESFLNLNNEIKNNIVKEARKKQKLRDAYLNKHILTGLMASPSNYIDNWTKHHDEIWYKGQNGQLETTEEQTEYQQLLSVVNQAATNIFAQYEGVKYPGLGTLYTNSAIEEEYNPNKHGGGITYAKGGKIDKLKINNFINKLK